MKSLFSTNQVEDILNYNNKILNLYKSPLELIDSFSFKLFGSELYMTPSFCLKGFEANWIIKADTLYLSDVRECNSGKTLDDKVEKILNRKFKNGLIKADWVSSRIWAGFGSVPDGLVGFYTSYYPVEYQLDMKSGYIEHIDTFSSSDCEYDDPRSLETFLNANFDYKKVNINQINLNLSVLIIVNEFGKIKEASIENPTNTNLDTELIRVLKMVPCRRFYYYKGKYVELLEIIDFKIVKGLIKINIR